MASAYLINNRSAIYIVKVSKTDRGRRTVVKQEFRDYDEAMDFLDKMEEKYGDQYIVEFDSRFS